MPDRGLAVLGRFARVVSDAAAADEVLARLADALFEHVSPDGVAVFTLASDGKLRLAAERGTAGELASLEIDIDEVADLPAKVRSAAGRAVVSHVSRPLVAGGSLYGDVILLWKSDARRSLALADGLIDLAAMSLGTSAHVAQLERQFAELRAQQEILARTEKLRALGQMAAGISHDLKNILNPLSLHLQVVTRSLDRGKVDDAKESAAEMKQALDRGLETLERIRAFSRQSSDEKTALVALDELAREAAAIGKTRATSVKGRLPKFVDELASPPPVNAIAGEVVSALVNLVVNAIDAGADVITLRSGSEDRESWVEVADNGPGMPPDVARRVFEPFFTTKGTEGTGLGLAMVYASMQRLGGDVTVDSAPGKGTRFRLRFPV